MERQAATADPPSASGQWPTPDEYDFDSSDDEDIRNTVGNIPMHWYAKYGHIGYSTDGSKILKPGGAASGDGLDDFLAKLEDPDYWRTVEDPSTGQRVVLCQEDVDLVKNLVRGRVPDPNVDPYEEQVDWFTSEKMVTPVTAHPPHKRSFLPSKWERIKVGRMVHAIKMGWMKTTRQKELEAGEAADGDKRFYDIWDQAEDEPAARRRIPYVRPPKRAPPTNYESYNPPDEFLFDEDERRAWETQEDYERKVNFVPQKYKALRRVPAYANYTLELYERCQDLHLAARVMRHRVSMEPEDLLPKLPAPRDLRPFPHLRALQFSVGEGLACTSCSLSPSGQWLAVGDSAGGLSIFELLTGYRVRRRRLCDSGPLVCARWNPNPATPCVLAGSGGQIFVVGTDRCDRLQLKKFKELWAQLPACGDSWRLGGSGDKEEEEDGDGLLASVRLPAGHELRHLAWHAQGDYFLSVADSADKKALLVHRLTGRSTQAPFSGAKGRPRCAQFDPAKPVLYVAEETKVQVYDLAKQAKVKTLRPNAKRPSCLAVHPSGSHVYVGSEDARLAWFDLDLAVTPYRQLRIHAGPVRQVAIHKRLPISASVGDDGSALVLHSKVFDDLMQNPLLVPVKRLRGHQGAAATDCDFHPRLAWLVTVGADGRVNVYSS